MTRAFSLFVHWNNILLSHYVYVYSHLNKLLQIVKANLFLPELRVFLS